MLYTFLWARQSEPKGCRPLTTLFVVNRFTEIISVNSNGTCRITITVFESNNLMWFQTTQRGPLWGFFVLLFFFVWVEWGWLNLSFKVFIKVELFVISSPFLYWKPHVYFSVAKPDIWHRGPARPLVRTVRHYNRRDRGVCHVPVSSVYRQVPDQETPHRGLHPCPSLRQRLVDITIFINVS